MSDSTTKPTDGVHLVAARYGKDMVRVLRVVRGQDGWHNLVEYNVCTLVEGDIGVRYEFIRGLGYRHAHNERI